MVWEYVPFEDAVSQSGLRMTVVSGVPSPWGEAAKGIFHVKRLDWSGVQLDPNNPDVGGWSQSDSGTYVVFENEHARSGWADILLLAERLAPEPSLLPPDPAERAQAFGLAHELCGEDGLGWSRRLWLVHLGVMEKGGFSKPVAQYLAQKYGYREQSGIAARGRVLDILNLISDRLSAQKAKGSDYIFDCHMTVVDIYIATFAALLQPLPDDVCPMRANTRRAFSDIDRKSTRLNSSH